jgi:hypothetical protein
MPKSRANVPKSEMGKTATFCTKIYFLSEIILIFVGKENKKTFVLIGIKK